MLRKLQEEQRPWVKHNFTKNGVERPSWMPILGVMEELGELTHAYLKRAQGIRINENHEAKMKDALADIIIFCADVASALDIDLESAVEETWDKVKERDWKKNKINAEKS